MKLAAVGSALIAFGHAAGLEAWASLSNSPEPLWMVLWGVALLSFAAAAREDRRRPEFKDEAAATRCTVMTPRHTH